MQRGPLAGARWWEIRRAQNLKPATYTCPVCGQRLPALSEHMLLVPEGRRDRRRHAHTACVLSARRDGRLPTKAEWQATQPAPTPARRSGPWRRLVAIVRGRVNGP